MKRAKACEAPFPGLPYRIECVRAGIYEVLIRGRQHFGSGGFSAFASILTGNPEEVTGTIRVESNSFTSKKFVKVKMTPGDAVLCRAGDCVGDGRDWTYILLCEAP